MKHSKKKGRKGHERQQETCETVYSSIVCGIGVPEGEKGSGQALKPMKDIKIDIQEV